MDGHRATYFPAVFLWAAILLLLCPVAAFSSDSGSKLSAEDREILRSFEERIIRIKQRQEIQRRAATGSSPSIPAEQAAIAEEAPQGGLPLPALGQEPAEEIRAALSHPAGPPPPSKETPLMAPAAFSSSEKSVLQPQIDDLRGRVETLENQLAELESRSSHSFGFGWLALGISLTGWFLVWQRRPPKTKHHPPPEETIPESFTGGARTGSPRQDTEREEILPWPPKESDPYNLNRWVESANQSFQNGDFRQADAIYRELLELQPQNFAIHCGIAELNVLAGRYEAGWDFLHLSLPRFLQPDERSILIFLAIAAGRLSGRETDELEVEFQQMMQKEFELSWNLEDMQQWIFTSGIPEGIQGELVREMKMLRSHQATRNRGTDIGIKRDSDLNTSPHLEKGKLCSG